MGTLCTSAGECIADAPPPPPTYATAPPTYPEEEEMLPIALVDPGARRHDGFMFRVAVGFGGGAATESAGASEARFTGLALQFSLDVGGAPAENLVLHARIADMVILNPNVTLEDPLLGTTDLGTLEDVSLSAMLFGPGITYYFMPVNLYLTGAVGMSYVTVSDRDDSASSDIGVGVNVDFGKEWWIGRYWGIGVAGRFAYSHVTNDSAGVDSKIDFVSGGVLFSATYQ